MLNTCECICVQYVFSLSLSVHIIQYFVCVMFRERERYCVSVMHIIYNVYVFTFGPVCPGMPLAPSAPGRPCKHTRTHIRHP